MLYLSESNKNDHVDSLLQIILTPLLHSIDRRYLIGLLAQILASIYVGLLVYNMYTRDACALYRLASVRLDLQTWTRVFGGTFRAKPFRPCTNPTTTIKPKLPVTRPPPPRIKR